MRAYLVVDLGFGDAGKGLATDFLVRHLHAGVVVRYNGGAQAGHNVVAPNGRHHTFSQFGSGTFVPGVKTFLAEQVVVHPGALLVEGDRLKEIGVHDAFARLRVSERALVITPFHQAANRIREMARGENRHGSCGVGVGEAVEDALANEDCVRAGDLSNPTALCRKLQFVCEQKRAQLIELCGERLREDALAREWQIFERADVSETWLAMIARINDLGLVTSDAVLQQWLQKTATVVFEGAQGVLLDADAGFHPYTTWSHCTAANARDLIAATMPDSQVFQIGVTRCYAVRHGPGPLPTETNVLAPVVFDHNQFNEWQGAVRYGWFDAVLARYAMRVTGKLDALVVTHLDVLSRLKTWNACIAYQAQPGFDDARLTNWRRAHSLSLEQRAELTRALAQVTPVLEVCDANDTQVIRKIESLVGQPVGMISKGPRAENVRVLNPIPG